MLCRSLRSLLIGRLILTAALCLSLVASVSVVSPVFPEEDEPTSMVFRAIQVPLAALATSAGLFRFEKQAQTSRYTLQKPERSGHLMPADHPYLLHAWSALRHGSRLLPRRSLSSRHLAQRPPSDAGDPFLASSLIC
jgi:hypothetical protein